MGCCTPAPVLVWLSPGNGWYALRASPSLLPPPGGSPPWRPAHAPPQPSPQDTGQRWIGALQAS